MHRGQHMDGRTGYITISADAGHETDLCTADLLDEVGLRATFYIPATNPQRPVMSNDEIRRGHTFHHRSLTGIGAEESRRAIIDAVLAHQVEAAGFACRRTCFLNLTELPSNPYTWGVSTQAFSHSRPIQIRHAAIEPNWTGLANYARIFRGAVDCQDHFTRSAAHVKSHGGIAHLFLHGWEIDQYDVGKSCGGCS
jgi:hypothetical protein